MRGHSLQCPCTQNAGIPCPRNACVHTPHMESGRGEVRGRVGIQTGPSGPRAAEALSHPGSQALTSAVAANELDRREEVTQPPGRCPQALPCRAVCGHPKSGTSAGGDKTEAPEQHAQRREEEGRCREGGCAQPS